MIRKSAEEKTQLFRVIPMLMLLAMIALFVCSTSQQASGTCVAPASSTYIKGGCQPGGTGVTYHIMVDKKDNSEIRRSYLTFDISGVSSLFEVDLVSLSIDNRSKEGGDVGVYLMPAGGCPDPPSGALLAQLSITAKGAWTFDLNKDLIPWAQDSFSVCLAMIDETHSGKKRHVDFKHPCLEIACNPPPVANDDAATTDENNPVNINVTANDSDIDGTINKTTVTITRDPQDGLLGRQRPL